MEQVSWNGTREFIKKLNEKERNKGWTYRLPTEAEWEYACRGGATSEKECSFHFYFDKPTNDLSSEQANFCGEGLFGKAPKGPCLDRTCKVGSYKPNKVGLYDMHGNVSQWCADLFEADGSGGGSDRVTRGGGWLEGERRLLGYEQQQLRADGTVVVPGLSTCPSSVGRQVRENEKRTPAHSGAEACGWTQNVASQCPTASGDGHHELSPDRGAVNANCRGSTGRLPLCMSRVRLFADWATACGRHGAFSSSSFCERLAHGPTLYGRPIGGPVPRLLSGATRRGAPDPATCRVVKACEPPDPGRDDMLSRPCLSRRGGGAVEWAAKAWRPARH